MTDAALPEKVLQAMANAHSNYSLPGNPRYQPKELNPFFGYDNLFRSLALVEIANLEVLGEMGVIPAEDFQLLTDEVKGWLRNIRTTDVDIVERMVTGHDVRAWVRLAQQQLPVPLRRWVHIPLTSYDALDTSRILNFKDAHCQVIGPAIEELLAVFADQIDKYRSVTQIGRTHGQHALPITAGFWLATIAQRILYNYDQMQNAYKALCGKISGAVGAYNAQVGVGLLKSQDHRTYEERVLRKLNLEAADISTQILPPEPLAYYLISCVMMSATLGQFGRDCRQLMRSEIGELSEQFEEGQVGSSTMAHKRNPINFEQLEGMWLKNQAELLKVLNTLLSEHQRDLVGSSVMRDFPTIVVNLKSQINTLMRPGKKDTRPFLERITINVEACERNMQTSAKQVMAEPFYIMLQMAGYEGDAHELVNHTLIPKVQGGLSLLDVATEEAQNDPELDQALRNIHADFKMLLQNPEQYIGAATLKATEISAQIRRRLSGI